MISKDDCLNPDIKYYLDNSGHRWRKAGQVKTWIRNTDRFRQPIKHGLYAYSAIDENNCSQFKVDPKQY